MVASAWVFLIYQLPREPSTPRIAVWRALKRIGVAQLSDGLVALPNRPHTTEQLEWVAQSVLDAGGSASVWIATPAVNRFGREVSGALAAARAEEYRKLVDEVETSLSADADHRRRALRRLRAEFQRIERRDHFAPPERGEAERALGVLSRSLEAVSTP